MKQRLNIAFFGSSLVSAYWNGAATYYRGIVRALHERGHRVTFYEPDAYLRQSHRDRKSTRLNSSHLVISYAVFCLKKQITSHHQDCEGAERERTPAETSQTTAIYSGPMIESKLDGFILSVLGFTNAIIPIPDLALE